MKYIVNEQNSCGQASLTESQRNSLLEQLGYAIPQVHESVAPEVASQEELQGGEDARPALYEWDSSVFALDSEVYEIDGDLFLMAVELDEETRLGLDESHGDLFITDVNFDSGDFSLGDVYDMDDTSYIKLEGKKDTGASKGDKGKDKDDPKAKDYENGGDRKGDDSKTHAGKDFEKNGNGNGDDDENGDPRAFGGKKGDKSKTHAGRDFENGKKKVKKEANGEEMSDDDIESTMNTAAEKKFGKGSAQAKLHRKASKLKKDPAAEKQAQSDASR